MHARAAQAVPEPTLVPCLPHSPSKCQPWSLAKEACEHDSVSLQKQRKTRICCELHLDFEANLVMFCRAGVWLCDTQPVQKPKGVLGFLGVQIVLFAHTGVLETLPHAGSKSSDPQGCNPSTGHPLEGVIPWQGYSKISWPPSELPPPPCDASRDSSASPSSSEQCCGNTRMGLVSARSSLGFGRCESRGALSPAQGTGRQGRLCVCKSRSPVP